MASKKNVKNNRAKQVAKRKKRQERSSSYQKPQIFFNNATKNLLGVELKNVLSRIDRKQGKCVVCNEILGKEDLSLSSFKHGTDMQITGTWFIQTAHRRCRKETAGFGKAAAPSHTYKVALVALPLADQGGLDEPLPTLFVNPSVDQFVYTKPAKGKVYDEFEKFLQEKSNFQVMSNDSEAPDMEAEEFGLTAYVSGPDVTVASDQGYSWTFVSADNREVRAALGEQLEQLVKAWDGMMVLVSSKFQLDDVTKMLRDDFADLINNGHVLSAQTTYEFRPSVAELVSRAAEKAAGMPAPTTEA